MSADHQVTSANAGEPGPAGKAKGKVPEEKTNMKKGGGFGSKGKEADEEDERDRVAPNMGAGTHQATWDPRKEEKDSKEKGEGRESRQEDKRERWADWEDDEGEEEGEKEQETEKETRQETEQEELTRNHRVWTRKQAGGA